MTNSEVSMIARGCRIGLSCDKCHKSGRYDGSQFCVERLLWDLAERLDEADKRQETIEPIPVFIHNDRVVEYYCKCGKTIMARDNYCYNCGRKFNWGEE